jgi:formylmethanofuran dehydrogenase subunit C
MNTITFTLREQPELYLEVEEMTPDYCAGKSAAEIATMPVYMGNRTLTLGEFFDVSGKGGPSADKTKLIVNGDLRKIKYIGMKMTAGEIVVNGNTDMYTGAWMNGGSITVNGNVDSFAGIGMEGGSLTINGNAKDYLGAAYRGDWRGMLGGTITVKGNVGSDTGFSMNGGTIDIGGDTDFHVGIRAVGGKIIIRGNSKGRIGGQMVKGEVIVLGEVERMMPSFLYAGDTEIELDGKMIPVQLWQGDMGDRHDKRKGEIIYGKLYLKSEEAVIPDTQKVVKEKVVKEKKFDRGEKVKLTDAQKAEVVNYFKGEEISPSALKKLVKEKFNIDMKIMYAARIAQELQKK